MRKEPFMTTLLKVASIIFVSLTTVTVFFIGLFIVLGVLVGVASEAVSDMPETLPVRYSTLYGQGGGKLLSIPVSGMILGEKEDMTSPLDVFSSGISYGYDIKQQLMDAAEDASIKGVVLAINSPGGTIYGSHAIADGVAYYKGKTKKPVIASISGLGASGAYWAAASTDAIFADYGSTVGSIGVLFGPFQYYDKVLSEDGGAFLGGVVTQNGIETTYITAGKSKDIGNPYRQLTPEEITAMQQSVNNEYDDFVSYVSARRGIPVAVLKEEIGAMIYENKSAERLRLINSTKNKQQVYSELARRAGLKEDSFHVVTVKQEPTLVQMFLSSISNRQSSSATSCPTHIFSTLLVYFGDITSVCQR